MNFSDYVPTSISGNVEIEDPDRDVKTTSRPFVHVNWEGQVVGIRDGEVEALRREHLFLDILSSNKRVLKFGIMGDVISMILNTIVVITLSTNDELRTVQLFPILLQSILDFVFTGLLPLPVSCYLLYLLGNAPLINFHASTSFLTFNVNVGSMRVNFCKIFTVCDGFTLGSTGFTIMAVAFVRFIHECLPSFQGSRDASLQFFPQDNGVLGLSHCLSESASSV